MSYADDLGANIYEFNYPKEAPVFPNYYSDKDGIFTYTTQSERPFVIQYLRINLALDIETTTIDQQAVPYIITVSLNVAHRNDYYIYHMRNWQDTQKLMDQIAKRYKVGKRYKPRGKRVLICFVHNLSFEFYFCRHELDFDFSDYGFFAKEPRKCMKATLSNGIELRDSLALTNSSLVQLSKMYTKHKKKKDLDYKKRRNTLTSLTPEEMRYINEDVIILNEFSDIFFDRFAMDGYALPLTNTARLLLKVRKRAETVNFDDVVLMQPTASEMEAEARYLFRGGFVHGNLQYLDYVCNCHMIDITSSYPDSMLNGYFPMSPFEEIDLQEKSFFKGKESPEFVYYLKEKCVKMRVIYYGLRAITDHSYESKSKTISFLPYTDDVTNGLDNGRVRRAEIIEVWQTELDFFIYQLLYDWDCMEVISFKVAERGKLPEYLTSCLIEDYKIKNNLKTAGQDGTKEYMLAKINVNTYFGMCCKGIYAENIGYDGTDWTHEKQSLSDMQDDLDRRFLCFSWGIWVAAQSRYKLVKMLCAIERLGGHVIYYDTDSLKFILDSDGRVLYMINEENDRIRANNMKNPLLQDAAFYGKYGKGLGEWDYEKKDENGNPESVEFKTLGSKRYLYHTKQDDWKLCIAGLPKVAVKLLPDKPFEFFSKYGFSFKGEDTGKLRPVFSDEEYTLVIKDDEGHEESITAKSGIALVPVDFDITENKLYSLFIAQAKEREIKKCLEEKK